MQKFVSRGLWGVLFVGGLSVLGATAANAAETTGEDGVAAGTQAIITVELPVTIAGNGIGVLGTADSSGGTTPAPAPTVAVSPPASTSGADAILSGTQALLDVAVPITLADNAISVLGESSAAPAPAAAPTATPAEAPAAPVAAEPTTDGSDGVASGTQVVPVVTAPITIGDNAISVLGSSSVEGAEATAGEPVATGPASAPSTDGSDGVASGTQVVPVITAPLTVGGNAIGVLGDSTTTGSAAGGAGDADEASGDPLADDTEPGTPGTGSGDDTDGAVPGTGGGAVSDGTTPGAGEAGVGNFGAVAADGSAAVATAALAAAAVPALAATGNSPAGAGLFSLLLLAAGMGLVALKRMRARVA